MEYLLFTCLVLVLTCLFIFVCYHLKTRRLRVLAAKLPGPPTLPLIGNAHQLFGHPDDTFDLILNVLGKYGDVVRLWLGPQLFVIITEPNDVEAILGNPKIRNRDVTVSSTIENIVGPSILTTTDEKWKSHRQLITPLFHFRILESYIEIFGRKASSLLDRLEQYTDGRTFDVYHELRVTTLNSICETVIGVNLDSQLPGDMDIRVLLNRALELIHDRLFRPWLMINWIYPFTENAAETAKITKKVHEFASVVIGKKTAEYQAGKGPNLKESSRTKKILSLSDLLIASSAENVDVTLTKEEIRDEVVIIAISGLEATATTMACALVMIAMHPEIQQELVAELRQVFNGDDRAATAQDIANLHGLRRVLKETLRIFPAVPMLPREITEDMKLPSGHVLPAGCSALVLSYVTHRKEEYWPDPEDFKPNRWLSEASTSRHPYAFIPFSAGPRNCVGQKYAMLQMTSVLSSVLRKYEITTDMRMEDLKKIRVSITIIPVHGLEVQLKKREWP